MSNPIADDVRQHQLQAIEAAFGTVTLGDGVSLRQARAMDDWLSRPDIAAMRAKDPEARWQDISDPKLEKFADVLAFMDAAGFRFYIPRFMVYALEHIGDGSGSFAIVAPVYACDCSDDLKEHDLAMYTLLSADQRRVIARFLRLMSHHDGMIDANSAVSALDQFWSQYE